MNRAANWAIAKSALAYSSVVEALPNTAVGLPPLEVALPFWALSSKGM